MLITRKKKMCCIWLKKLDQIQQFLDQIEQIKENEMGQ